MTDETAKRCAYLTMDSTDGWTIDADLGFAPMEELGWQVEAIPWRSAARDWNDYDAVYIGVPWDYPEDPAHFISLLESIDRSPALLVNDLALVRWGIEKTYLRDLESRGAEIVPSMWYEDMQPELLADAFAGFACEQIIVKPVISTNATHTYLLDRQSAEELGSELRERFSERPFVVQPFIENILVEGEFSLFYFNCQFSHAIQKIPKPADFRVQEEYGADISPIDPEPGLLAAGDKVMQLVEPMPVYARADFVRGPNGRFLVMELELIEPSMYLRMNAEAPGRFAAAFNQYVADHSGAGSI